MSGRLEDAVRHLAGLLSDTRRGIVFTGAGISTESGIDDFRSPGGLWSRHTPVLFQDFLADPEERRRFWRIRREMIPGFLNARPNAGHHAIARLEAMGRVRAVITQNIDELHQRAGSRNVVEVHGTAMKVHCLSCDKRWPCEEIQIRLEAGGEHDRLGLSTTVERARVGSGRDTAWKDLLCDDCGGLLKSMTVSFGQELPPAVWMEAMQLARDCDLFLAMGSSLVVHPAAALPETAKKSGARLIIINREETPMDRIADLVIHAPIGETMSAVMSRLV